MNLVCKDVDKPIECSHPICDISNAMVCGVVKVPLFGLVIFDVIFFGLSFPCLMPVKFRKKLINTSKS